MQHPSDFRPQWNPPKGKFPDRDDMHRLNVLFRRAEKQDEAAEHLLEEYAYRYADDAGSFYALFLLLTLSWIRWHLDESITLPGEISGKPACDEPNNEFEVANFHHLASLNMARREEYDRLWRKQGRADNSFGCYSMWNGLPAI